MIIWSFLYLIFKPSIAILSWNVRWKFGDDIVASTRGVGEPLASLQGGGGMFDLMAY